MVELQTALLARAAGWLSPGGKLVYSVCSLEREEGEPVATACPLPLEPISAGELPAGLAPTPEGYVRTDPGMLVNEGGLDGFFIARFRANG
jgi:16S rRNA (cytosine967-C5)-methyltransferase